MGYQSLAFAMDGAVARLSLNRPEAANAMDLAFWQEMADVFAALEEQREARVVVIDGAGKHFTSGMDLQVFASLQGGESDDPARLREQLRRTVLEFQDSFNAIERCRLPVIAAIHGACVGGGMDLIAATDMRYCTADAFFSIHEINIAMAADVGTLQRLPHLIPAGLMRELAYTGRRLGADEAKACGLVNEVFADKAAMMTAVGKIAGEIASKSPIAVAGTKEMLTYARDHSVADGLNYIATWNAAMLSGADMPAALAAQGERRAAEFEDLLPPRRVVRRRS